MQYALINSHNLNNTPTKTSDIAQTVTCSVHIWPKHIGMVKITVNLAMQQMSYFKAKMHQILFRRPRWVASALPQLVGR